MTKNTFRTGDLFAVALPRGQFLTGRILLDVARQCVKPRLLPEGSPLGFFNGCVLVELYRDVGPEPLTRPTRRLVNGAFFGPQSLDSGRWRIVGHVAVEPREVEFPAGLVVSGIKVLLRWGELTLKTNLTGNDFDRIPVRQTILPSAAVAEIALHLLGRDAEVENPSFSKPELRGLEDDDARFSPMCERIFGSVGLTGAESYYDLAKGQGLDLARFYKTSDIGTDDEEMIFCPYCYEQIEEDTVICPACQRDTTRDAKVELTSAGLASMGQASCVSCGRQIVALATICRICRTRQRGVGLEPPS